MEKEDRNKKFFQCNFFPKNRGGQFFLIAAVVIIVVIVSIATVSNYTQKKDVVKLYDLGQELGTESQQVLDYGTYNQLNDTQMNALMENFIQNYVSYVKESKNVYFVFGNKDKINVLGYQEIKNESVCVKISPEPICGNGIVEDDEQCDDGASNGATGDPCSSTCTLITSSMTAPICGDGIVEGNEQCDDGTSNGLSQDPCFSNCTLVNPSGGCTGINAFCSSTNLNGETCSSLGFSSGTLACNTQCGFDVSGCVKAGYCGDGNIENGKQCDGTNLNGKTCSSLGFNEPTTISSGTALKCNKNCNFDTSSCVIAGTCSSYLTIGAPQEFSTGTGKEIDKIAIMIANTEYEFTLKPGENFYFVIWENVTGEKQVVTS